jgi:ribosomal protein S18 acetylase RimI-like enzyme
MSRPEFEAWLPAVIVDYAEQHAVSGSRPAEKSLELAHQEFAELLPDGVETDQQHLLVATLDGHRIGIVWLNIPPDGPASVYDVEVEPALRGKGYGRAVMLVAESYARSHGATTLRLHVFGGNTVARSLYESLGYETTNVMMSKSLQDSSLET